MAWKWILVCVHCHLENGDMTLVQGHDTPFGHGQQLCVILSRSNMAVRSYGLDTDFGYMCSDLDLQMGQGGYKKVMVWTLCEQTDRQMGWGGCG